MTHLQSEIDTLKTALEDADLTTIVQFANDGRFAMIHLLWVVCHLLESPDATYRLAKIFHDEDAPLITNKVQTLVKLVRNEQYQGVVQAISKLPRNEAVSVLCELQERLTTAEYLIPVLKEIYENPEMMGSEV